jgi:MFS transporter, putative metabolite:H+ symporter
MPDPAAAVDARWRSFQHPVAFWLGALACTAGVALHLPMYIGARSVGYRMAGMQPDPAMIVGMVLIGAGLVASLYGLLPARAGQIRRRAARIRVSALDDAPIRLPHIALLAVMAIAITIDVMKPTTLAFVAPGVAKEYGLKSAANPHGHLPVSLLPLAGIVGTVIGSLVWGALADRVGRRASIIFASLLFVTTAICGAMPGFSWNLLMCFMMGIAAGGMLPIAFALMSETIPARHRGWLVVLIGGDVAGAYVITSWLAGWLTPHYSWRIMWLIGLPTGLLLIVLNRWIPESPRYLLAAGQRQAAEEIMLRYGAAVVTEDPSDQDVLRADSGSSFLRLLRRPLTGATIAIAILAAGAGLVTYGFQLWIPTNLQHLGLTAVNSDYIVRNAAVIGLPLTFLVAWLYGFWSSKKTIIVLSGVTALTLLGFVIAGNSVAHHHVLLAALLVVPLSGTSSLVAVALAYSSEIYPTRIRSQGTGLAAGVTKAGGVLIIATVVAATTIPSIAQTALIGAIPLVLAMGIFTWTGRETHQRRLEEITAEGLALARPS